MKKKIIPIILTASIVLVGCGNATAGNDGGADKDSNDISKETESSLFTDTEIPKYVLSKETVYENGSPMEETEYQYDEKGNEIQMIVRDAAYGSETTVTREYDDKGNITSSVAMLTKEGNSSVSEEDRNGDFDSLYELADAIEEKSKNGYFYYKERVENGSDNFAQQLFFYWLASVTGCENTYDSDGNLETVFYKIRTEDGDDKVGYEEDYSYDEKGNICFIELKLAANPAEEGSEDDFTILLKEAFSYDEENNLISAAFYTDDSMYCTLEPESTYVYASDEKGNPYAAYVESFTSDTSSHNMEYAMNCYDKNGFLVTKFETGKMAMSTATVTTYEYIELKTGEVVSEAIDSIDGLWEIGQEEDIGDRWYELYQGKRNLLTSYTGLEADKYCFGDFNGDHELEYFAVTVGGDSFSPVFDLYYVGSDDQIKLIGSYSGFDEDSLELEETVLDGTCAVKMHFMEDFDFSSNLYFVMNGDEVSQVNVPASIQGFKVGGTGVTYGSEIVEVPLTDQGIKYYGSNTFEYIPVRLNGSNLENMQFEEISEGQFNSYTNASEVLSAAKEKISEIDYMGIYDGITMEMRKITPVGYVRNGNLIYVNFDANFIAGNGFPLATTEGGETGEMVYLLNPTAGACAEFLTVGNELQLMSVRLGYAE